MFYAWLAGSFSMLGMAVFGLVVALVFGYLAAPIWAWAIGVFGYLWLCGCPEELAYAAFGVLAVMSIPPIRQIIFSAPVMKILTALKLLPQISETERVALEAGTTWVEGELFSGKPDFDKILNEPYPDVSGKEKAFLDGPCETVCRMVDNEQTYKDGDLSPEVWAYLKKERFLGLIIPEEFGGRGFSALGHSEVISKLGTRSIPLAITVMVPNSLGPGELLTHYGTDEQKRHYLPRLSKGEEIPCFGLTESTAGSDAGSISANAEVFKGTDGKLYLRMNWKKRYITLGAVATILGIATKLRDPENLLGKGKDVGITCVLVPSSTKGVVLGMRHDPLGVPFYNCPIEGHDVVVSIDQIIGGEKGAGKGWQMLMESLAAGRSISLPAQSTGTSKFVTRVCSAYAEVRQQFGVSLSSFEGIQEVLGKIGGLTYMLEASRIFTAGAVDSGLKPAVVSAIAKYNSTEISRQIINYGMDICGGSGISRGPKNLLANFYTAAPIGITVEGANILTRTMIIFGQGAIRCHPYAYLEMKALNENNLKDFDKAFTGHVGHMVRNVCRSVLLSVTRGAIAQAPKSPMAKYYRKISWASASFATLSDIAMASLGGSLKLREQLTGRFADILSWMYLISATLRRYEAEGQRSDHEVFVHFAVQHGFAQMQKAFDGILKNFPVPVLGWLFKYPLAFYSRMNQFSADPSDAISQEIVKALSVPGSLRDSITLRGLYLPYENHEAMAKLEKAMILVHEEKAIMVKVIHAIKAGLISRGKAHTKVDEALEKGIINKNEWETLNQARDIRNEVIQVDAFPLAEYGHGKVNTGIKIAVSF